MTGPSLLELSRRRRATQPPPLTPVGSAPSSPPTNNLSSDATPSPFLESSATSGIRTTAASRDRLRTFADRAIKRLKVSEQTAAEFRQYIEVNFYFMPPIFIRLTALV